MKKVNSLSIHLYLTDVQANEYGYLKFCCKYEEMLL